MVGEASLRLYRLSRDVGGVRCEPWSGGESPRWRKERPAHQIRWLDGVTSSTDMSLSKLWEIVKGREA